MKIPNKMFAGTVALAMMAGAVAAETEVHWWHAMGGTNGERVNKIADDFNASQSDYKVVPTYKGNYTETMTAAIAAFRAGEQPHLSRAAMYVSQKRFGDCFRFSPRCSNQASCAHARESLTLRVCR